MIALVLQILTFITHKMKFSVTDFLSKCEPVADNCEFINFYQRNLYRIMFLSAGGGEIIPLLFKLPQFFTSEIVQEHILQNNTIKCVCIIVNINIRYMRRICAIWYHLSNLKNVKNTHEGTLNPATGQKITLLHGCFPGFLSCTNGTKSCNAS